MEKKPFQNYSKYSGMAFQLLSAILFGALLGQWIDKKMMNERPIVAVIGSLLGIFIGLYISLKDFINPKDNKK